VGVLYHGLVNPGEVFSRETGAVHFTIKARINNSGEDDIKVLVEAALPTLSAAPCRGVAACYVDTTVGVALLKLTHVSMSSAGWYSGYRHELEICGGGQDQFKIRDKNTNRVFIL
jgi:hypothetical protein